MRRVNLAVALFFLALGGALVIASYSFPAGMGRLPGPGFFPGAVGVTIVLLAALLLVGAVRSGSAESSGDIANRGALALTIGLLVVHLALWGTVPFPVRTFILLLVFLHVLGESWKHSAAVSAMLTMAVVLAFQYGLRVTLE